MTSLETLKDLLQVHQSIDLKYYRVEYNHAPMVLIALYRMGATSNQLLSYYQNLRIEETDENFSQLNINTENWKEHLGQFSSASSCCRFFINEISKRGVKLVLKEYLPQLMPGVAAHAYHPLLRLGYGINLKHETEIAMGLGYWVSTYLPCPVLNNNKNDITPEGLLKQILNSEALKVIPMKSPSITSRIKQVYDSAEFRELIQPLKLSRDPFGDISQLIVESFRDTHHFTLLHGVTSCQALRLVLPYCDDTRKTISEYWYSICAAFVTIRNMKGNFQQPFTDQQLDWPLIFEKAIKTNNEHTIKHAYTCFLESKEYNRKIYNQLAIRELSSPAPFE